MYIDEINAGEYKNLRRSLKGLKDDYPDLRINLDMYDCEEITEFCYETIDGPVNFSFTGLFCLRSVKLPANLEILLPDSFRNGI